VELSNGGSISQEVKPEDKMAANSQDGDIITLSFHHFFFKNDEGRAEDQELGQSVSLLADSCWQGALYGARSSDSCGILVGGPHSSPLDSFGEIDIPGGTTG
jgi:hypothetical protein